MWETFCLRFTSRTNCRQLCFMLSIQKQYISNIVGMVCINIPEETIFNGSVHIFQAEHDYILKAEHDYILKAEHDHILKAEHDYFEYFVCFSTYYSV